MFSQKNQSILIYHRCILVTVLFKVLVLIGRALDKREYLIILFLISHRNHML